MSSAPRLLTTACLLAAACAPFSVIDGPTEGGLESQAIVDGGRADPGQFPFQAVVRSGDVVCSGVAVGEHAILTSASCLSADQPTTVALTDTDFDSGPVFPVLDTIVHPSADLALLEIDALVQSWGDISAVIGPFEGYIAAPGTRATITGFGETAPGNGLSEALRFAHLPIMDRDECDGELGCAGFEFGGAGACTGDQGGPVLVDHLGTWVLVGIAHADADCGSQPLHYTRVGPQMDWLRENVHGLRQIHMGHVYPAIDDHEDENLALATEVLLDATPDSIHGYLTPGDVDLFELRLLEERPLDMHWFSTPELVVELLDQDGEALFFHPDLAQPPFEEGDYYLRVRAADTEQSGEYLITLPIIEEPVLETW